MTSSVDIFTHVTFIDVPECYYHLKDVKCQFSVSPVLKPESDDIVGIYKVGWRTTKDFICSQAVVVPPDFTPETTLDASVIFSVAELPVDTSDFYQFCYVSHADQRTHGISSPFQLSADEAAVGWEVVVNEHVSSANDTEPSMIETEGENQCMAQQNEERIEGLKQELIAKNKELATLSAEKEKYATELHSKNELETTVDELRKCYLDSETKCQVLTLTIETNEVKLKSQAERISFLEQQVNDVIAEREKCRAELMELTQKYQSHVEEDRCQKEDAAAEIAHLVATMERRETEWKASEEATMRDLQEQLNAERARNAELEEEVKTYAALKQLVSTSRTTRDDTRHQEGEETNTEDLATSAERSRYCPVCQLLFADDEHDKVIYGHVMSHLASICPVCDKEFSPNDYRNCMHHIEACLLQSGQVQ